MLGFDRGYVREKNKLINKENLKFLEIKYVLYTLKTKCRTCFKKKSELLIKILRI